MLRAFLISLCLAGPASADFRKVIDAASTSFADMPAVGTWAKINTCGTGEGTNPEIVYCTTDRMIAMEMRASASDRAPYLLAHVYGHAVQVKHGVADVALRTITANRDREVELRRDVTRMVECIAGVILSRAGLSADLEELFEVEPFTDSHWGRFPMTRGPKVSIGLAERNRWLQKGLAAGHPSACNTPNFPADLVVAAFREE